ncbi:MAG: SpoIIE family protein phosphatase [Roseofilum sp. SID2]|uniref:SpoIIE family protein phosphatase n=1 Tax=Roseofilum sp. SID2 TaxID=2821498 RepID=UPI001B25C73D|nr:SpoIIE family protein phosphatase [Roseofilum sp. SID2]MBP0024917.1 SpoIIE family protein phosphatase [Roseofilum sp. SID2]
MVWKFCGRLIKPLVYHLSLRTLLTVPFILQLGVVTVVITGLSFRSGKEAVDVLVKQLGRETSDRIAQVLAMELAQPHSVYQTIQGAIDTDQIDIEDFEQLQCYFQRLVKQDNGVDYLLFGRPTGEVLAVQQLPNGETVVKVREGSIPERKTYRLDRMCDRQELLSTQPYDARLKNWYKTAVEKRNPTWSEISISSYPYLNTGEYFLYAKPVTPVARSTGEILGVLGAEISLTYINELLKSLKVSPSGIAFIVDQSGAVVSSSTDELLYQFDQDKPKRVQAIHSTNPLIKDTSQYLLHRFDNWENLSSQKQLLFDRHSQNHLVHTAPLTDNHGLDWLVIVVIPISDFMGPIYTNLSHTLILCLSALLVASLIGSITAQRVINPIKKLSESAKAVAQGEWYNRVTLRRFDELRELADSFNRMADQIQLSFSDLETKNQELERIDRLKDEFLANTSYELRTPLNGIIGLAESILETTSVKLCEHTQFNLSLIVSSGRRLVNLVNNILDLSRLNYDELTLNCKAVELRAIAEVTLTQCYPLIGTKNIKIKNQIPSDIPLVCADEKRLEQIFYELINNAIKFTDFGCIILIATRVDDYLEITVQDSGIGISEDKIDRIFKPFEQENEQIAQMYGGLGLGLALTKRLIELHGGELHVVSTLGLGSSFIFTLPITDNVNSKESTSQEERISDLTHVSSMAQIWQPTNCQNEKHKILIVDDELTDLQFYTSYLNSGDYGIISAQSGEEALDLLAQGLIPDLMIVDVMMPRMTGYEVTRQVRLTQSPTELPIILLSTNNQVTDLVMGLELGANDYLTKPVSKDGFLARVKMHLNLKSLKLENLRLATEVEITSRLQKILLPNTESLPVIEDLEIAGFMETADEVGGDYYDVFLQDKGIIVSIGDVTGHGLESGVLAIMVQTAIRCLSYSQFADIKDFFTILNRTILENIERMNSDKHLTLSLLEYNEGVLRLSGQHESLIIVRSMGEVECIDTLDLGFPIGLDRNVGTFFHQLELALNPGDVAVLYTDGITEAENLDKVHYGIDRLCTMIKSDRHQSADEIKTAIIADLKHYIGTQKIYDDITLIILKRKAIALSEG